MNYRQGWDKPIYQNTVKYTKNGCISRSLCEKYSGLTLITSRKSKVCKVQTKVIRVNTGKSDHF